MRLHYESFSKGSDDFKLFAKCNRSANRRMHLREKELLDEFLNKSIVEESFSQKAVKYLRNIFR